MDSRDIGLSGERAAAAFLKAKGYTIVQPNYRAAGAEIDLVACIGDILCFVEVKTRKACDHGEPSAFVSPAQQRRIIRAARVFAARRPWRGHRLRFDVVSVLPGGGGVGPVCDHIEGAFEE